MKEKISTEFWKIKTENVYYLRQVKIQSTNKNSTRNLTGQQDNLPVTFSKQNLSNEYLTVWD